MRRVASWFSAYSILLVVVPLLCVPSALAQEESVKPGINDGYQKPGVEPFVKRFENDKRAVVVKREEILAACRLQPGMVVADVGSGTGLFTLPIAKAAGPKGRVYAVDVTEQFVKHVQDICSERGLENVVGIVCRPTSTELPAGVADLVFTSDVYHHFEFPFKMLKSIRESLKDDGILIVVDRKAASDHVRASQSQVKKEVTESGFEFLDELDLAKDEYLMRFRKTAVAK